MILKTRSDEKDGEEVEGDLIRKTGWAKEIQDHYAIMRKRNRYSPAEMASVGQDDVWQEN